MQLLKYISKKTLDLKYVEENFLKAILSKYYNFGGKF